MLAFKRAEEVPDHDIGIDRMSGVAKFGHRDRGARPDVAAIADPVMFDDCPIGAVGPFDRSDIGLVEDRLADAGIALIDGKPEIQEGLYRKFRRRTVIGGELVGQTMNLQHREWA